MIDYSIVRYLLAKKSVDDRALNQTVLAALRRELPTPSEQRRLEILELGAGVGTMVSRLSDWNLVRDASFTLVDQDLESLRAARAELERWAPRSEPMADGGLRLSSGDAELRVRFVHEDALALVAAPEHRQRYDLVMANAVLDVMDLRPALQQIWQALAPQGLFWFSINFDGETIFLPEAALDEQVMALYHRSMDERVRDGKPCGDSKTGRHLLELVPKTGKSLVAAGSSDWVVFPRAGAYEKDEAYFLHYLVNIMWTELESHPELDRDRFAAWVRSRHDQIDRGQLTFIAHQLDVLGRA
jgi:SAM-dependent methyltransferase